MSAALAHYLEEIRSKISENFLKSDKNNSIRSPESEDTILIYKGRKAEPSTIRSRTTQREKEGLIVSSSSRVTCPNSFRRSLNIQVDHQSLSGGGLIC